MEDDFKQKPRLEEHDEFLAKAENGRTVGFLNGIL